MGIRSPAIVRIRRRDAHKIYPSPKMHRIECCQLFCFLSSLATQNIADVPNSEDNHRRVTYLDDINTRAHQTTNIGPRQIDHPRDNEKNGEDRVLCAIFPLLVRELDERLGLSSLIAEHLTGDRRGKLRHYYRLNNGGAGDLRVQCFPFRSQKGNLC